MLTSSARSPMTSSSMARTSAVSHPGRVRMSTSSSTRSGITLILVPARMTVGAIVVWVQAWAWRARPTRGSSSQKSSIRSGSSRGSASSGGKPIPSMKRVHASCSWACGPVLVDAADHLGRLDQGVVGPEGLAAVARGALDRQPAPEDPLLAHDHRKPGGPVGPAHGEAPRLGDHVVGVDVVGGVLAQPLGTVGAEGLLVGHGHVGEVTGRAGSRSWPGGGSRWPWWR